MNILVAYAGLLNEIKLRIQSAQTRGVLAVSAELIGLYWKVGALLDPRQAEEGWGEEVVPRLARDIGNELREVKGFSECNLKRMLAFYRAWADTPIVRERVPQPFAPTEATNIYRRKHGDETGTEATGIMAVEPLESRGDRSIRRCNRRLPDTSPWLRDHLHGGRARVDIGFVGLA